MRSANSHFRTVYEETVIMRKGGTIGHFKITNTKKKLDMAHEIVKKQTNSTKQGNLNRK